MSDLINNIGAGAGEWNRHLVWIAVNVGYIKAELPHLEQQGCATDDIVEWLQAWPYLQEAIARHELAAYTAARRAEAGEGDVEAIKAPLEKLKGMLRLWLKGMYEITERHSRGEPNVAGMLMNCCGAEIQGAHGRFVEHVDIFLMILKFMPIGEEAEGTVH